MDRSLLIIAMIVFIVGLVGVLTVMPKVPLGGVTGNVVQEQVDDPCAQCTGEPVCAGKYGKALTYPSACHAQCDGARILYPDRCERIPRA